MKIKIFNTQKAAADFAFQFLKKGRIVGVKKLKSGKYEARILASRR